MLGTPLDTGRALVDAGFNLDFTGGVQIFLGYSGALSGHTESHAAKALFVVKF